MRTLRSLLADESGQAMTSNASFLAGCALVGAGLWYYGGHEVYRFIDMVTSTLPPDGPNAGTNLR
jgi:hypothetical protein